ncbi:TraB/GumN family protein [Methylonatrum kenyense]|uniref:TraB/GumN family protein n=1 Tax=Methylonatrum kenyense TaxID=455253 RepID=UPI0020BDC61F|nr:TraB/GumN family protein [Methylonatrum kenyense]MCK8514869.1 TraB/GumN family protein [Methylonatrum kenyense]
MAVSSTFRWFILLILCLGVSGILAADEQEHPALWRVDSGDSTLYLFGTMHLLPEGHAPLAPVIERAFEASDVLVLEMNLSNLNQAEIQQLMFQRGLNTDGRRLSAIVGPERWAEVRAAVEQVGLQPVLLEGMQPWLAGMTLTLSSLHQLGMRPDQGVESYLLRQAGEDMEVRELEKFREQLGVLANLSEQTQIALLMQTAREMDDLETITRQTLEAWSAGDVAAQERYLLETYSDYPDLYQALIVDRHRNWLPQLEAMLAEPGTYFIAVGALHLVGEDSVLDGLRRAGHAPERVRERGG